MYLLLALQIRWEKNITLGEPPGFLHSWWWLVFVYAHRGVQHRISNITLYMK